MSESRDLVADRRDGVRGGGCGRHRLWRVKKEDLRRREISNYNFRVSRPRLGPREPPFCVDVCQDA